MDQRHIDVIVVIVVVCVGHLNVWADLLAHELKRTNLAPTRHREHVQLPQKQFFVDERLICQIHLNYLRLPFFLAGFGLRL